jgi:hypothetical protein
MNRIEDSRGQVPGKRLRTKLLMLRIHAVIGNIFACVVQQVAQVVQQRCGYQRVAAAFALYKPRRLQRVLKLRHWLAAVCLSATLSKELENLIH